MAAGQAAIAAAALTIAENGDGAQPQHRSNTSDGLWHCPEYASGGMHPCFALVPMDLIRRLKAHRTRLPMTPSQDPAEVNLKFNGIPT
jgi:hypothetical protein